MCAIARDASLVPLIVCTYLGGTDEVPTTSITLSPYNLDTLCILPASLEPVDKNRFNSADCSYSSNVFASTALNLLATPVRIACKLSITVSMRLFSFTEPACLILKPLHNI